MPQWERTRGSRFNKVYKRKLSTVSDMDVDAAMHNARKKIIGSAVAVLALALMEVALAARRFCK